MNLSPTIQELIEDETKRRVDLYKKELAVLDKEKTDFSASLKSAYEEIKHLKSINDSMGKQLMGKDGEIENLENEVLRLKGMMAQINTVMN